MQLQSITPAPPHKRLVGLVATLTGLSAFHAAPAEGAFIL